VGLSVCFTANGHKLRFCTGPICHAEHVRCAQCELHEASRNWRIAIPFAEFTLSLSRGSG